MRKAIQKLLLRYLRHVLDQERAWWYEKGREDGEEKGYSQGWEEGYHAGSSHFEPLGEEPHHNG